MALKDLAERVLQGNRQGNMKETKCFLAKKTGKHFQGHKETRKETIPTEVIRSTLAELNAAGSWADCPMLPDNEARELEETVDRAALAVRFASGYGEPRPTRRFDR